MASETGVAFGGQGLRDLLYGAVPPHSVRGADARAADLQACSAQCTEVVAQIGCDLPSTR